MTVLVLFEFNCLIGVCVFIQCFHKVDCW